MSKEDNLIPKDLSQRPDHKELSAKGGKSKSKNKSKGATLRHLKEGHGNVEEHIRRLITEPDYCAKDLAIYTEAIKKHPKLTPKDKISLGSLLNQRMKTLHGDKQKIEHSGKVEGVVVNIITPKENKEE